MRYTEVLCFAWRVIVQLQKLPSFQWPSSQRPFIYPFVFRPPLSRPPLFPAASSATACHVFFHYQLQHFRCHCGMTFVLLTWRRLFSGILDAPRNRIFLHILHIFPCTFNYERNFHLHAGPVTDFCLPEHRKKWNLILLLFIIYFFIK